MHLNLNHARVNKNKTGVTKLEKMKYLSQHMLTEYLEDLGLDLQAHDFKCHLGDVQTKLNPTPWKMF